jgi:hypothetical protein
VMHRAVDRRDQTDPAIAHHSKRDHPILASGVTFGEMMKRHLVCE